MESLAQPPPPPGSLKRGGGGAASQLLLEEAAAAGEGGCRDGPAAAEEGGGRRSPSPQPAPAPAEAPRPASPSRAAEDDAGLAVPESPGAAPTSESGPAGAGSGSSGAPSPPGEESRSLDSLESFSNLHSCCPSSSELNSDAEEAAGAASGGPAPEPEGERPAAGPQLLSASKERFPGQSVYHIKWVRWKEENTPIITQNENGPCPLLAIMNVLLLAWKIKLPPMMEIITAEQLMEYLGDYILDAKPKEISEIQRLNYEQNMSDAMAILHKLQTGLDVNVKFTGVRVFEYTPECIVFDLLDIPLYHGWLVDPQVADIVKAVGNCSYNQLVEKIISCKQSDNSELVSEGFVAEQFLNNTATQLTYHGLCELTSAVQEGELCVFFRNNHFSTMTKYKLELQQVLHGISPSGTFSNVLYAPLPFLQPNLAFQPSSTLASGLVRDVSLTPRPAHFILSEFEIEKFGLVELKKTKIQQKPLLGQLYLLVTDQGFLTEEKVVWESLHNVDGDGNFCDSEFHLRPPSDPETVYRGQQDQIDQDYLMALSLQQEQQNQEINWEQIPEGISDLELAKKLQEEEDRRASQYYQEQEQAAAQVQQVQGAPSPASGRQSGSNERKRKEPREKEKEKEKNSCVLL